MLRGWTKLASLVAFVALVQVCVCAATWTPCIAPDNLLLVLDPPQHSGSGSSQDEPYTLACVSVATSETVGDAITLPANPAVSSTVQFIGSPIGLFWVSEHTGNQFTPYFLSAATGETTKLADIVAEQSTQDYFASGMAYDVATDTLFLVVGDEHATSLDVYVWHHASSPSASNPVLFGQISTATISFHPSFSWTFGNGMLMGVATVESHLSYSQACSPSTYTSASSTSPYSTTQPPSPPSHTRHQGKRLDTNDDKSSSIYGCVAYLVTYNLTSGESAIFQMDRFVTATNIAWDAPRATLVVTVDVGHFVATTGLLALVDPLSGAYSMVNLTLPHMAVPDCSLGANTALYLPLDATAERTATSVLACPTQKSLSSSSLNSVELVVNDIDTGKLISATPVPSIVGRYLVTGFLPQC